jgi:ABC-type transport system involved in multi-copper enzyme maturation permease subunit
MFAAELLKIRSMPAPRLALIISLALVVVAAVIVAIVGPTGTNASAYYDAPATAASIAVSVGAIVLGAWMIGLEFSSKTMRLAATVQPSRLRLLAVKFACALLLILSYMLVVFALSLLIEALMASIGSVSFPFTTQLDDSISLLLQSLLWGAFAFGLALLFRSYTAGLVGTLVFSLLVDPALQLIPTVGKYSFSSAATAIGDLTTGGSSFGTGEPSLALGVALITAAGWLVVVIGAGSARFITRDLG